MYHIEVKSITHHYNMILILKIYKQKDSYIIN